MGTAKDPALQVGISSDSRVLRIGQPKKEKEPKVWEGTEATRYLCASAYLNNSLRHWVIKHYMENKHIALGVSYGIDPVTILKHCLIAERIKRNCDLLLFIPFLIVVFGLFSVDPFIRLATLIVGLLAAFAILCWEQWTVEFKIVRQKFTKKHFDPGTNSTHFNSHEEKVFQEVDSAQQANVIIHAAFSPFVGCGIAIGSWSIPVDLTKGKEDVAGYLRPKPVEIKDLYQEIYHSLHGLQLPNCSMEDKLCISGLDIRGEADFLPDPNSRPKTNLTPEAMNQHIVQPTCQSRHYQNFRLVDWSGELVLNTFLRAAKSGPNLFLEVSYWLLVPVDEVYRRVDNMNPVPTTKDWGELVLSCLLKSALIWIIWPFRILAMVIHPLLAWSARREADSMVRENPAFNHGSVNSLREATSTSNVYRRYFQKIDKEMYLKTLENQILTCIVRFLDERNVDTSDLKLAQTKIINSGIIVSGGGSVEANSLAVGRGSSATSNTSHGIGAVRFISGLKGKREGV